MLRSGLARSGGAGSCPGSPRTADHAVNLLMVAADQRVTCPCACAHPGGPPAPGRLGPPHGPGRPIAVSRSRRSSSKPGQLARWACTQRPNCSPSNTVSLGEDADLEEPGRRRGLSAGMAGSSSPGRTMAMLATIHLQSLLWLPLQAAHLLRDAPYAVRPAEERDVGGRGGQGGVDRCDAHRWRG